MKHKRILIAFLALVIIAVVFVVLEKTHVTNFIKRSPNPTTSENGPSPQQKKQEDAVNADTKKQLIEDKGSDDSNSTNNNTPISSSIDLSVKQESNGTVTVFTKLSGYSNGDCKLTVTNGTKVTTQTAAVYYQPEHSSCAGFSVPVSAVGAGTWSITLMVTSNGSSASKTVTAKVD